MQLRPFYIYRCVASKYVLSGKLYGQRKKAELKNIAKILVDISFIVTPDWDANTLSD